MNITKKQSFIAISQIILILLLYLYPINTAFTKTSVAVLNNIAGEQTLLNFGFEFDTPVRNGSCVFVDFTNPYSAFDPGWGPFLPFLEIKCTGLSLLLCQKGPLVNNQMIVTFKIPDNKFYASDVQFQNPYSEIVITPISFKYSETCDDTKILFSGTPSQLSFVKAALPNPTITSSSTVVGQTSQVLSFQFTPVNLQRSGQIDFLFPAWYNIGGVDSAQKLLAISNPQGDCFASLGSITVDSCSITGQVLTVKFSAYTSSPSIGISVKNFKNPVNRNTKQGFQVTTKDLGGNKIAESINTLPLSTAMATPTQIGIATFSFTDKVVSTYSDFRLSFTYPIPTELNCFIEIVFPVDLPIDQSKATSFIGTGFFQNDATTSLSSGYISWNGAQTLRVQACKNPSMIQTTTTTGPAGTITIKQIQVPGQVKQTQPIQINTYQASDYATTSLIAQGSFVVPEDAMTTGTVALTSFVPVTPSEFLVQRNGATYTIKFIPSHKLYASSKIIIQPPVNIQSNECTYISGGSTITGTPRCTKTSSGWEVINLWVDDGNPLTAEYAGGSEIQLSLGSGTNPNSEQDAGQWSILTQNQISGQFYNVDYGIKATSFTTTIGSLSTQTITSSSLVTGARDAEYTFTLTTDHYIPSSGFLDIIYPNDVQAVAISTCLYGTTEFFPSTCTFIPNGYRIKITSGYSPGDGALVLKIGTFQNPRTYKPTAAFSIVTYDSQLRRVDSGSGFSLTMNTKGELNAVSVFKSNGVNGQMADFTITITSIIMNILNGDIFFITFPPELTLSYQSCVEGSLITKISCSAVGNVLQAQLVTVRANTGSFSFIVKEAKNAPSWKPTSSFVNIYTQDQAGFHSQQYSGIITVKNDVAAQINSAGVVLSQGSQLPNTLTTFSVTFKTINQISTTGAIILNYPQQITVANNAACIVTTTKQFQNVCQVDQSAFSIKITGVFPTNLPGNSLIQIQIQATTPFNNTQTIDKFYFSTYDDIALSYKIDELIKEQSTLQVKIECDFPCKTCNSNIGRNFCNTCWASTDNVKQTYLQYFFENSVMQQTCQEQCNSGFSANGTSPPICKACHQNCSTCLDNGKVGDSNKCITCSPNFNYKYLNQTCLSSCPAGWYVSSVVNGENICSQCKSPCATCNGTDTNCTSCNVNSNFPILFGSGCIAGCPSGYTKINGQCLQCQSPCLECSGSTSICTECDGSLDRKYLFASKCLAQCPNGTALNVTTLKCDGCLEGCNVCDTKSQKICLDCKQPFVNYDGSCEIACPENFLLDSDRKCKSYSIVTKPKIVWRNNTIYIPTSTVIKDINITHPNGTIQTIQITNTTYYTVVLPLVYFPHLIGAGIAVLISVGGYIKDRQHALITNIILLIGPIELLAYLIQTLFSFFQTTLLTVWLLALVAFGAKVFLNVTFWLFYIFLIKADSGFENWRIQHVYSTRCIACMGCTLSFKMYKFLYSFFFGLDKFKADFDRPKVYKVLIILYTVLNWLFCYVPILFVDVESLIINETGLFQWGTQLYICLIETTILSLIQFILSIVEFFRFNRLVDDPTSPYKQVMADSVMEGLPDNTTDPNAVNQLRLLLEKYLPKNRNNLDELRERFGDRNCQSEEDIGNELEDDPRKTRSYPLTPKGLRQKNLGYGQLKRNNVYADGKDPVRPKVFHDKIAQVLDMPNKLRINLPLTDDGDDDMNYRRNRSKKRGRKNEFYNQIDEEDDKDGKLHHYDTDEEIEFKTPSQKNKGYDKAVVSRKGGKVKDSKKFGNSTLDMIEEEKDKEKVKKKNKIDSEKKRKRLEKEKRLREQERKMIEDERKRLEDQIIKERVTQIMENERKPFKSKKKPKKPNTTKAKKEKFLDSELGFDSTYKEENLLIDDNESGNWKQREYEDIMKGLEEENLQKEIEAQRQREMEEYEAKKLEQQIQEETDLFRKDSIEGLESMQKSPFKTVVISEGDQDNDNEPVPASQIPNTEVKVKGKAKDLINGEKLPIPKRPQTAGAKSEHSVTQDVLMGQESLAHFILNDEQIEVPPKVENRSFNINDILGDLDHDDLGNIIPVLDENGKQIDKKGRRVNDKGYLIDPENGDILEKENGRKMFDSKDLDPSGEIPAPFCFEKFNFNPHQILGEFDYDILGKPILNVNSKGQNIDKNGKIVNKNGLLIDSEGNVIDKAGRIKFDKTQLNQNDNLPFINYNRKKYNIQDVIGVFKRDPKGGIIMRKNKSGELIDDKGRRVNEKGYLIDKKGNIIDKDGKKIFDEKHLKNGEPPKIFKFSKKIKPSKMRGNFDFDPIGNPVLFKNEEGQLIDKDGNRVNQKGYLVDNEGNVIDKRGKKVFDKDLLDKRGNIPKVYLRRRIETDSESSLSRLMSEIEKDLQSDGDPNEKEIQRKIAKLQAQIRQSQRAGEEEKDALDSGHTSVDSQMEDTPSNYNLANQRYDHLKKNLEKAVDQIEEELDSDIGSLGPQGHLTADMWSSEKKKRRRRRKRLFEKIDIYLKPTERDVMLATAYGGRPIPRKVTKVIPVLPRSRKRMRTPSQFEGSEYPKDTLSKLTNVLAGSQADRGDGSSIKDQFNDTITEKVQNNFYPQKEETKSLMATSDLKLNQSVKQSKILRDRKKKRETLPMASRNEMMMDGEAEFQKMFGKNLDDLLDESDWDLGSLENMSQISQSRGNVKSALGQGRVKNLETIYMKRLETSQKNRSGLPSMDQSTRRKPRFRQQQDNKFMESTQQVHEFLEPIHASMGRRLSNKKQR